MSLTHFAGSRCAKRTINVTTDIKKVTCAACFIIAASAAPTNFAVIPLTDSEDMTENMMDRVTLFSTDLEIESGLFNELTADYAQYNQEFTIASW